MDLPKLHMSSTDKTGAPRASAQGRRRGFRLSLLGMLALVPALLLPVGGSAQAQDRSVPRSAAELTLSFAPVVAQARPAVVNVYASRTVESRPASPFFDDPFFDDMICEKPDIRSDSARRKAASPG